MGKVIEGLWDCPYCGAKGIGGLTKHCPTCGHPQDAGTKFYVGQRKTVLSQEQVSKAGSGPDWVCSYCGSYNRSEAQECTNCGAPREEAQGNYFTQPKPVKESVAPAPAPRKKLIVHPPIPWKLLLAVGIPFLILCLVMGSLIMPKNRSGSIDQLNWQRSIEISEYRTVQEDDWSLPAGGRLIKTREELYGYEQVLDHYETVTREVAYEVQDGYDIEYEDNGNGTFTEVSVPRYRTEYRTETDREPVYRDEPIYKTKYYYDIDKWIVIREDVEEDTWERTPVWPEEDLAQNQREESRDEEYTVVCRDEKKDKTYVYTCSQEEWEQYQAGQAIDFVTEGNTVTEITGK